MADIYGSHFEYDGRSSFEFGIIMVNITSERFTNLSGVIEGVTIFNKSSKRNYLIDDNYSNSPVAFEVDFITENERVLFQDECRKIEKWLFNRHNYRRFYIDTLDDCGESPYEAIDQKAKRLYRNCRFINPSRIEDGNGTVGYHATVECDSGYWWQDAISKTFNIDNNSSGYTEIKVKVDTDIDDYVYPKVSILTGLSGGDITITNATDDTQRQTKFEDIPPNTLLTIRSDINYISGNYYQNFINRYFPRLLDGINHIIVGGDIKTITYEFNNMRFL